MSQQRKPEKHGTMTDGQAMIFYPILGAILVTVIWIWIGGPFHIYVPIIGGVLGLLTVGHTMNHGGRY